MKKKILIIVLIVSLVLGIVFVFKIFNNNFIIRISKTLKNTLNAEYVEFEVKLNNNRFIGNMKYDVDNLNFLIYAMQNDKEMKIDISKEKSSFLYYLKIFDEWITVDITNMVEKYLPKENAKFKITKIFELLGIDDVIDISDFPDELSNDFKLKFFDKAFLNDTLNFKEEVKNKKITYTFKPDTYKFLKEYIECSNLEKNKISEMLRLLKENKQELNEIKIKISVSINSNDYITDISFQKINGDEQINFEVNLDKYK